MKNKNKELMDMEDDIYSRHPKPHNLPLWKILNEQRTSEKWDVHSNNEIHPLSDEDGVRIIADFTNEDISVAIPKAEQDANAQYTALAVNNLHILAEALEAVIRVADRKTEEFDKAKQALNNIS